ncbi:MAG: helix-turn-helix domain-containing protein [Anaerolineae bacterium]
MTMRTTTLEDRMTILTLAQAGHKDADIAQRTGWSVRTVRKWRSRGEKQGRHGLTSHMGRPVTRAMSTFPPLVVEKLRALRQAYPGWGPMTLRTELEDDVSLREPLPSRTTIARWLKQEGMTQPYERHQDLPPSVPTSVQAPHEEWEMDTRGYEKVPRVGVVTLINLNDRFSKVKLLSYPFSTCSPFHLVRLESDTTFRDFGDMA